MFRNSLFSNDGSLAITSVHSPQYQTGVNGWTINKDGSAEFNNATFRGRIVIQSSGQTVLVYDGTPAAGNLIASIAAQSGTDAFGNFYPAGVADYSVLPAFPANQSGSFAQIFKSGLLINDPDYAGDGSVIGITSGGLATQSPSISVQSPGNQRSAIKATAAFLNLAGISQDGTATPFATIGGTDNSNNHYPANLQVLGNIFAVNIDSGTFSTSFAALTSFTVAVPFNHTFSSIPAVSTNINSGSGTTSHWSSRAFSVTTTGFTLFVYSDTGAAAQTWASVPVQWMAIGT